MKNEGIKNLRSNLGISSGGGGNFIRVIKMRDLGIPQEPHNLLRRRRKFYDGRKNEGITNFRRNLVICTGGGGNR